MALCAEHLDEIAFLYAQCQYLLTGSSSPWPNAQRFEKRLMANLDALSIEGALALSACETRTDSTDPGDLYAAARMFCRHNQPDLIGNILDNLALDNERKVIAVCNALVDEAIYHPELILDILAAHPAHIRVAARVAADARLKDAWPLMQSQKKHPPYTLAQVLRLSGRIYKNGAFLLLTHSLNHDDEDVRSEAALALLRLGNFHDVMRHCRSHKNSIFALGLAGGKSEVSFLIQLAKNSLLTRDILVSLGLLGDISAIPILIDNLAREELSESAAQALELITGAGIEENIFIPDPIDKKELFKEERKKLEQGESPYPPGKEPGLTITRISQKPEDWKKWLDENRRRFIPETRYRNGKPYTPEGLIENMKSEIHPKFLRQFAYEELVIRYKKDIPFETDRPAYFQKQAIEKYEAWIKTTDKSFHKGQWYFASQLMT